MSAEDPDRQTVLIVDDEQDLCDLYATWLAEEYDTAVAYGGEEALERVDEGVDVVLLDRRMPDLSGGEVLAEIRDRGLPCRVAMITAVDPDFDIVDMGFDDYVTKPVSEDELRSVVDSLLERRRYDDRAQELFSLTSTRGALEAEKSEVELADSEEYADLVARIEDLRSELDEQVEGFDHDDARAAFLTLESDGDRPEPMPDDPDDSNPEPDR